MAMSDITTYSDGRTLPFLVESHKITKRNGGSDSETLMEQYAVSTRKLQPWLEAVPLEKDGLELQNVSPQKQGAVTLVTLEYATPGTNTNETSTAWWTSTGEGLVFHEQRYITLAESHAVASAAISKRHGLKPNGCNVSVQADGIHAIADSSWGPNEATEDEDGNNTPGGGGDGDGGGEPGGGGDGDGDAGQNTSTDTGISMASALGTVTLTGEDALKYRLGEANYDLLNNEVDNWKTYAAAIQTGSLIYAPLPAFSGGGGGPVWQWASGSALPNQPAPNIPEGAVDLLKYGGQAMSAGAISVPVPVYKAEITSTMKIVAKSPALALQQVMQNGGGGSDSLPGLSSRDIGNGIIVNYTWERVGVSTSGGITSVKKYKNFGAGSGGSLYVTEYSITYTTSYEAQPSV